MPPNEAPTDKLRILTFDGGGIRGLIPALVLAELESRLVARAGDDARICDYFHLFAGTSTGGLIALGLTVPDPGRPGRPLVDAAELAGLYVEDGPRIFHRTLWQRLRTLWGLIGPKYTLGPLEDAVVARLGTGRLAEALREVIVASYDMTDRSPYFFKRWRAREDAARNSPVVDAALATAAAPTYFPPRELDGHALVDGGVFAANPVIAAITETLKRTESPGRLETEDLMVVSIGTGLHEEGFRAEEIRGWGRLGWILPKRGEPPILGAVLDGASDGADHWAHMLLNHAPGSGAPEASEIGRGPRYFRLQVPLDDAIGLDDASEDALQRRLPEAAAALIASRDSELEAITERLIAAGPLPQDRP